MKEGYMGYIPDKTLEGELRLLDCIATLV
jgi:hypothetical protein